MRPMSQPSISRVFWQSIRPTKAASSLCRIPRLLSSERIVRSTRSGAQSWPGTMPPLRRSTWGPARFGCSSSASIPASMSSASARESGGSPLNCALDDNCRQRWTRLRTLIGPLRLPAILRPRVSLVSGWKKRHDRRPLDTGPALFCLRSSRARASMARSGPLHTLLAIPLRLAVATVFWDSAMAHLANWQTTLELFETEYALPFLPSHPSAYLAVTIELSTPPLLVVGLLTQPAAAVLLGMTAVIEVFVYPLAWPTHIQWAAMLLVLLCRGPGKLSVDWLIGRRLFAPDGSDHRS